MRVKIVIGVILLLTGIGLFFCSEYITKQVAIGRGEIYRGQSQVNGINGLIDNTTNVKGLGNVFTGSAQNKINEGKREANYYEILAARIKLGGIVLVIVSILFLIFSRSKKWFLGRK